MRTIELNHSLLRSFVRFTDPFIHSPKKEHEVLSYFRAGALRPPSLVEHGSQYLIFNGNHRVLVAIGNKLTISCNVLESIDDVLVAQANEGERFRDLSAVSSLTFEGVLLELIRARFLDGGGRWRLRDVFGSGRYVVSVPGGARGRRRHRGDQEDVGTD